MAADECLKLLEARLHEPKKVLSEEVKVLVKEVARMVERIRAQSREENVDIQKLIDALFTREQARIDRELAKAPRGCEVNRVTPDVALDTDRFSSPCNKHGAFAGISLASFQAYRAQDQFERVKLYSYDISAPTSRTP
uniref:Uncharacterized protein n=1 Tax=Dunaliella tertiolecta TaxID=3047 RepID=A0A7S3R0D2_DUNTE|mmetsp:Transcript_22853/g.59740  ORF Transcript_22853/g.59740 Transcript_22853/m.59740 type:complete len:138 (+) Transcript_22853:1718-2131(+)|eukprot:1153786-Pelagomonas_calceolata.AAC.4